MDVGSGPGDYLSTMLDTFLAAQGRGRTCAGDGGDARPALAPYRDRVFRLVDLDLSALRGRPT